MSKVTEETIKTLRTNIRALHTYKLLIPQYHTSLSDRILENIIVSKNIRYEMNMLRGAVYSYNNEIKNMISIVELGWFRERHYDLFDLMSVVFTYLRQ